MRTGAPNIVTKNTSSDNIHSGDIIHSDNITIVHQNTAREVIIQVRIIHVMVAGLVEKQ